MMVSPRTSEEKGVDAFFSCSCFGFRVQRSEHFRADTRCTSGADSCASRSKFFSKFSGSERAGKASPSARRTHGADNFRTETSRCGQERKPPVVDPPRSAERAACAHRQSARQAGGFLPGQADKYRTSRTLAWSPDSSQKGAGFCLFASTVLPRNRGRGFEQNDALNVIALGCNHLGMVSAVGIEPTTY